MKRTTLVLDEKLLEEATRLPAQRTYSKTVDLALSEFRATGAGREAPLHVSWSWGEGVASCPEGRLRARGTNGMAPADLLLPKFVAPCDELQTPHFGCGPQAAL